MKLNEAAGLLQRHSRQQLNPQEQQALQAVQDTFADYRHGLALARQLIGQGLALEAIDTQVSVDDAAALSALQVLLREGVVGAELAKPNTELSIKRWTSFLSANLH